jgi:hypothetical protein
MNSGRIEEDWQVGKSVTKTWRRGVECFTRVHTGVLWAISLLLDTVQTVIRTSYLSDTYSRYNVFEIIERHRVREKENKIEESGEHRTLRKHS